MAQELSITSDPWSLLQGLARFDFICEVDQEGRYRRLSSNYSTVLGYKDKDLLGHTPFELGLFHADDADALQGAVRLLLETGEPFRRECRFLLADKSYSWIEITGHSFLTAEGELRALFVSKNISDRVRIREELRRESRILHDVIDHNPLSIQILNRDGQTLSTNRAFLHLFGYSPSSGHSMWGHPCFEQHEQSALLQAVRRGKTVFFPDVYIDVHCQHPELPPKQTWLRTMAFPILDTQGKPELYVFMHEDISARRNAEQALKESEKRLAEMIDYLPDPTLAVDAQRRVTVWNRAIEKLTGVPAKEMIGRGDHAYTIPFFGERRPQLMDLLWEENSELESRYRILQRETDTIFAEAFAPVPREGRGMYMWLKTAALRDGQGHLVGAVETIRDVTNFRQAEQALRESEDRFRGLYLNTPDAIFWVAVESNGAFRYEGANPAHAILTGVSSERLLGKQPHECLDASSADAVLLDYRRCVELGEPICYEQNFQQGATHRYVETLLVPIRDQEGRIYRLVGTSRDTTQAKNAEEALRQAQKLESLGVLAGGIAHDFNNLLTAILGNLNLAQTQMPEDSPEQRHLGAAERIVLKASDLIRQLLAYAGKGRFVVCSQNLNDVVRDMAHLLQVSISKKVNLQLKLADRIPAIEADSAQIQQVILNLVTNASDAIGEQEGIIRITTCVEELDASYIAQTFSTQTLKPGRFVTLEVSDTGCGITHEVMDRIFDPFFTTKVSGRGLGLSAMLGILRGHGAGYKIYSEVGQGTTFKIFFPASESHPDAISIEPDEQPSQRLKGTVLLVDDEPAILESVHQTLELFGLQVITARDGREALELFQKEPESIDLVLMDVTMPRMDGRESFQALHAIRPNVCVVLSSGYSKEDSLQELLGDGLAGFIQKPYRMKELRTVIEACLRKP